MIYEDYTIFTPGPVKMSKEILELGAKQTPYFRNNEFSNVLLSCEKNLLSLVNAPENSKVIFLTASGTAGMESVVMNLLNENDNALVVNGGGFGQRFVDICSSYEIKHTNYKVKNTNLKDISQNINGNNFNTFIVNAHETSIGHLYDLEAIGNFCKESNILNIVDAISMFTTDELDMQKQNIDTIILSSQKGLALPPGLTMIILNEKSIEKLNDIKSYYFNFKNYLKDGVRGQTPYTPCVSIILQLEYRLNQIIKDGGINSTIKKANDIANHFREEISSLKFSFYSEFMPNAMTTLRVPNNINAKDIVNILENEYKIIVCPNGGDIGKELFRISHMGNLNKNDINDLVSALKIIDAKL